MRPARDRPIFGAIRRKEKESFTEDFWYLWGKKKDPDKPSLSRRRRFAMIRIKMAFPAFVLLFTFGVFAGQTLLRRRARRWRTRCAVAAAIAAESSVIVVKPGLTDEQLADLYMARRTIESRAFYKRLADQSLRIPVYLNKLGIALHQQAALSAALKYYEAHRRLILPMPMRRTTLGQIWYQRKKYGRAIKGVSKGDYIGRYGRLQQQPWLPMEKKYTGPLVPNINRP